MNGTILVVGAGFAGACHARELAEAGWRVQVIDRRDHIAGNAFDEDVASGVRLHRYGPHLLHTNNERVVEWLSRFGAFIPYEHRVQALLPDGARVPLPVNRRTINRVFGLALASEAEVRDFLAGQSRQIAQPRNAAEHLQARIGTTLTDLFFRPYTRKMWAMELEEMDAAVVARIPLRLDEEDRYFPADRFQLLPRDGYASVFARMLDHPNIRVSLGVGFERGMLRGVAHCFNSMAIDEFFGFALGRLPYRSLRFHHRDAPARGDGRAATLNFTDDGPHTRETDWSQLPGHVIRATGRTTLTREEPCDERDNGGERYYPVPDSAGAHAALYRAYARLAEDWPAMTFIGRCGTYRYLDMHQVINQSVAGARAWIAARR
jgi:UDP-galactopyranose mutase